MSGHVAVCPCSKCLDRSHPVGPTADPVVHAAAKRTSGAIGYLYDTVRRVGWSGWHPDDYDPTDDDLVALIAQVKEDTGRAVSEWVGANFGAGVQARFEREFPLPDDGSDEG